MPAFVLTSLPSQTLRDAWPKEYVTPTSTINRAFMELIDEVGKVKQDGNSDGIDGVVKTSQCVEAAVDKLYYRKGVASADKSQEFLREQAEEGGLWSVMYGGAKGVVRAMREKEGKGETD